MPERSQRTMPQTRPPLHLLARPDLGDALALSPICGSQGGLDQIPDSETNPLGLPRYKCPKLVEHSEMPPMLPGCP
eukprot:1424311-Karenia_brevis.AAC.1